MNTLLKYLPITVLILCTGCSTLFDLRQPVVNVETAQPEVPLATQTPLPTPTALPSPTLTPSPTPTPASTHTPTPISTPTPTLHPMEIVAMRQGSYPGSDIVIDKELEKGPNFRRYYAWYRSEGLKIYGMLTIPQAPMPQGGHPALVFLHGSIEPTIYRTLERYVAYTDWLSRSGYVVFKIDLRGHDRSEGVATGAYSTPGFTVDTLNAVAALQRHPQVNPEKIGMWGHSMGGFLTLRAMVISKQIKVGVIWAGLVCDYPDMFYRWRRNPATVTPRVFSGWRAEWIASNGTPEEAPEFWKAVSANTYLADLSGPLQLHHGTGDTSVPAVFSEELDVAVKEVGGTSELHIYKADNHNLSVSFATAMTRTVQFFDKYLK